MAKKGKELYLVLGGLVTSHAFGAHDEYTCEVVSAASPGKAAAGACEPTDEGDVVYVIPVVELKKFRYVVERSETVLKKTEEK